MAENIDNVIVGKGKLYIGDVGATAPSAAGTFGYDSSAGMKIEVIVDSDDWASLGFMGDNIEVKLVTDTVDFKAKGFTTAITSAVKAKGASGKFTIYEVNAANLALALNAVTLNGTKIVDGGEGAPINFKSLLIVTDKHVINFKKIALSGDVSLKLGDADYLDIPLDFKCYADTTAGVPENERIYSIEERTEV